MTITDRFNVLGVAGSTRQRSYSTQALNIALDNAKKHGAEVRMLELGKTILPLYNLGSGSKGVEEASDAVGWANAFILASPDYHGSMSGAIKNFLDHFYEEFAGKLFGYIVASHEKGLTVMEQMRTAVRQCYGWSMPYGVSINGEQDFGPGGEMSNARLAKRIQMMSRDLVAYGKIINGQFVRDLGSTEQNTFASHYRP
ncbi:MAG TPA: NAD(P)H-dependent oxidoreductase [Nitrososphaera sp.]|jgi:NAD(P)H-dependent FMN reductase|nr:NAD(P)H-dependent oxidoreductase [Nitrososphaera sp.]